MEWAPVPIYTTQIILLDNEDHDICIVNFLHKKGGLKTKISKFAQIH